MQTLWNICVYELISHIYPFVLSTFNTLSSYLIFVLLFFQVSRYFIIITGLICISIEIYCCYISFNIDRAYYLVATKYCSICTFVSVSTTFNCKNCQSTFSYTLTSICNSLNLLTHNHCHLIGLSTQFWLFMHRYKSTIVRSGRLCFISISCDNM